MSILSICQWLQDTYIGTSIRESTLMFPIIEGTHVLGLGLSVGTVALFDLRLLGKGLRREPASQIMRQLMPWSLAGFILMFVTGILLFWCQAEKAYDSIYFRIKLVLLLLAGVNALVFQLTAYRNMAEWEQAPVAPRGARWAGGLSLAFWIGIIAAGRTMAYKF